MTDTPETIDPIDAEHSAPDLSGGGDLDAVRELVLRAHPDVVPEMIAGASIDALLASVEPARAAWQRIAEQTNPAPAVPAGGHPASAVDPDRLSASERIRRGLARGR